MKVLHVAGARPNFMKVAPVMRALRHAGAGALLVHTGQHYDEGMSGAFLEDLALPEPVAWLGAGSGSHAAQTARVLERIEPVLLEHRPDLVVVVGDVNSTLAAALAACKLHLPVAHVEAGLRSFDWAMPEEVNRVLTDRLSDLLFTTSPEAEGNLVREGIDPARIRFTGNPMIDSLEAHLERARASDAAARLGLEDGAYGVVTLHRPANVDDPARLRGLLEALREVAKECSLVFPAHPRTARMMSEQGLEGMVDAIGGAAPGTLSVVPPVGYVDFLALLSGARIVLTDSGGIQEETAVLGVACVTVRDNTERPITIAMGTNRLAGTDPERVRAVALEALAAPPPPPRRPPLWDGRAGERIAAAILEWGAG